MGRELVCINMYVKDGVATWIQKILGGGGGVSDYVSIFTLINMYVKDGVTT